MTGFSNPFQLSLSKHFHTSAQWTEEICRPLFEQCDGLCFFLYARFFNDKTTCGVMTDPLWGDIAIKENILLDFTPPILPITLKSLSFFSLWQDGVPEWVENEINQCAVYHPISYFDITEEYCDFYTFGVDVKNTVGINIYLNQLDILKKFTFFFREKSKSLFEKAQKFKLTPSGGIELDQSVLRKAIAQTEERSNLFDFNKEILSNHLKINLSNQEFNCLNVISSGKTVKECARLMNLSPKTVENYIYNLKCKLGVHRKSQLIDICQFFK